MAALANGLRLFFPLALGGMVYAWWGDRGIIQRRKHWRESVLRREIAVAVVALIFLLIGAAWMACDANLGTDFCFLSFSMLFAATLIPEKHVTNEAVKMFRISTAVFAVSFITYSASNTSSSAVLLAPVISLLLLDLILASQKIHVQ